MRSKNYENLRIDVDLGVDTEWEDVEYTVYTIVVVEVELIVVVDCDLLLKFSSSKVDTVVVVE